MKNLLNIVSVCIFLILAFNSPARAGEMCITFDDLPFVRIQDNETARDLTQRLLQPILEQKIPAIGFVNENKLESDGKLDPVRVELLKMWVDGGLELGNHTYSHIDLHRSSPEAFQQNIIQGEHVTRELMTAKGKTLQYFRHPYLHTGNSLEVKHQIEKFLSHKGYSVAPVTIDNSDWIFALAYEKAGEDLKEKIVNTYISYMGDKINYWENQARALTGRPIRQILLLHANQLNAEALPRLLQMIRTKGYEFISLAAALKDEVYRSRDSYVGPAGISWVHRWAITRGVDKNFFAGEPVTPQFVMDAAGIDEE